MTTEDVQKIFVSLEKMNGHLELFNNRLSVIEEQTKKTNGSVVKLRDDVTTIQLERATEKGKVVAYASVVSVFIGVVITWFKGLIT